MNCEISLPVTIEIESSEHNWPCYRFFEDSRGDRFVISHYDSGKTYIERNEIHNGLS